MVSRLIDRCISEGGSDSRSSCLTDVAALSMELFFRTNNWRWSRLRPGRTDVPEREDKKRVRDSFLSIPKVTVAARTHLHWVLDAVVSGSDLL